MSTVLKSVIAEGELNTTSSKKLNTDLISKKGNTKYGIRCRENNFKDKSNKTLKNKLKKYKIRRDGKEDPEVINVSHTFQCSLRIKSPNNNNTAELNLYDIELRPKNYLFKMVKRKHNAENAKNIKTSFKEVLRDTTSDGQIMSAKHFLTPNIQDIKHTNAFKLMMDSRNKSIGGNSPGKEKSVDETELQLITEEKKNKAKRFIVLRKMAEEKGSLKKQEKEEMLEEAIKEKMHKRAERLTNMLVQSSSNKQVKNKKGQLTLVNKELEVKLPILDKNVVDENKVSSRKSNGTLNLIDMFDEAVQTNKKDLIEKRVLKEDLEFLKKLSPSMKKKENMLCYFKKLEKDDEPLSPVETEDAGQCSPIIKVKFSARNKRKHKKTKLSLKTEKSFDIEDQNTCTEIKIQDEEGIVTNLAKNIKSDTRKRKREQITEVKEQNPIDSVEINESKNERPKRNVKKPTQYRDVFVLSSSDEEYNIFSPKKKKHIDTKFESQKLNKELKTATNFVSKPAKNNVKNTKSLLSNDITKKINVKLAPIFAPKLQLDQAALEAKQKFLLSGVPDKLKKIVSHQKQIETDINCFSTVVHIQQTVTTSNIIVNSSFNDFGSDSEADYSPVKCSDKMFQKILSPEKPTKNNLVSKPDNNIRKILQNIKMSYPKFPVYRTYHLLKAKSKGEFRDSQFLELDNSVEIINNIVDLNKMQIDNINWTDKYRPMATNQIIGNFETTKDLKKWLETWCANDVKGKTNDKADSDSSDFCYSDPDSRDSINNTDNLLILTGPTGCGKTSCVYAVATELAIKVIEVNASSKRNGKIMLQDLQEATQSHKVNRGKGSSAENSQKSQEGIDVDLTVEVNKKRGRPKKTKDVKSKKEVLSQSTKIQENRRTAMSLILIDDADIVFDQDEGFCSAISQLIQYSKRPVILVTTSLVCPHLQRFLQIGKIINMKPLLPRMLGTWLDIMCLADGGACWPGLGAVLLDLFKGDIRKTINCLQFYSSTRIQQESSQLEESSQNSLFLNDENSSMSWSGSENQEEHHLTGVTTCSQGDSALKYFMEKQCHLFYIRFPSDLWNVWWNLPSFVHNANENRKLTEEPNIKQKHNRDLNEIANIAEHISAADYFGHLRPDARFNISSQPWCSYECDSCSEYENFSYYSKSLDVNDDIAKTLVVRSTCHAHKNLKCKNELYLKPTMMSVQRNRERVVSRHNTISTHLNPATVLDRRALALDYWSSCRTICRFEKAKTDTNSKRNNRFCHYLRSLKVMCKNDVFDKLGESLSV